MIYTLESRHYTVLLLSVLKSRVYIQLSLQEYRYSGLVDANSITYFELSSDQLIASLQFTVSSVNQIRDTISTLDALV